MGKRGNAIAKKRLDKYYKLAKDEGFLSRAAFKLIQINREFNFLGECRCLIDLCAAPGGWTQVAAKHMPLSSLLIACDIVKMKPIGGAKTIQGDIFTQKCKFDIKKQLNGWLADAVIHDGAPNVTGAWATDAYGQCNLVLASLKLATQFLRQGGWFITKVFRSQDYNALLWVIQMFFDKVTVFKPIASRQSSAETYFICQGYLAPKKIDPRLLDPKFVFREIDEKKEGVSVMKQKTKKNARAPRVGYDQVGLLEKKTSVMDFINSEKPEIILGQYHSFEFDESSDECKILLQYSDYTTNEIKHLLKDLKVLGKSDFRKLLKWRMKMVRVLESKKSKEEKEKDNNNNDNDGTLVSMEELDLSKQLKKDVNSKTKEEIEKEEDLKMREEINQLFDKKKREDRNKKRKIRQEKIKRTRTMLMGGVKPDDIENWDTRDEQMGMFKLDDFVTGKELSEFVDKQKSVLLPEKYRGKVFKAKKKLLDVSDSEEEVLLEEDHLDKMYQRYKMNHNMHSKHEIKDMIKQGVTLESDEDGFSDIDNEIENENENENENGDMNDLDEFDKEYRSKRNEFETDILKKQLNRGGGLILMNSKEYDEKNENEKEYEYNGDSELGDDIEEGDQDEDNDDDDDEDDDDEDNDDMDDDMKKKNDSKPLQFKKQDKKDQASRWFANDIFDDVEPNDDLDEEEYYQTFGRLRNDDVDAIMDDRRSKRKEREFDRMQQQSQGATGINGIASENNETTKKFRHSDLPDILRLPYRLQRKLAKNTRDKRRRLAREEQQRIERDGLFEEVVSGVNKTELPNYIKLEREAKRLENEAKHDKIVSNSQKLKVNTKHKSNEDTKMGNTPNENENENEEEDNDEDDNNSEFEIVAKEDERLNAIQSQVSSYYQSGLGNALHNDKNESESDSEASDSSAIAETLAIGKEMICNKKKREEIINASYNRWSFNDDDHVNIDGETRLPSWFKDDESTAYNVNIPVSRSEIQEFKEKMKAINARPIKKVAEAKARKKLKAMRAWNKIKRQATSIADSNEISEKAKIKQIEKLYAKHGRKKKMEKVLMLSGKGRAARPVNGKRPQKGAVKVTVDKRLKADKLGHKHAQKRKLKGKIKKSTHRQMARHNLRKKRNKRH